MKLPTSEFEFYTYSPPLPYDTDVTPKIAVQTATTWTHVGSPLNPDSLPPSYYTWSHGTFGDEDIRPLLKPFLEFVDEWMKGTHMTHYCLTIRAQKPTNEFNIRRWHVDRKFFDDEDLQIYEVERKKGGGSTRDEKDRAKPSCWKLATTLMGPGTIFLKDTNNGRMLLEEVEQRLKMGSSKKGHFAVAQNHVCTSLRCLGCGEMARIARLELAEEVSIRGLDTVQVGKGQVVVFRVDGYAEGEGKGEGAMHSEPDMSGGDRIFVHVVPGREGELRRLMSSWGMVFPRDWSQGVLEEI